METVAATLPQQTIEAPDFSAVGETARDFKESAIRRWYQVQVFLGKSAMRQAIAMEAVGTTVDVGLMGAGFEDPLTREPVALFGDLAVLHHLSGEHGEPKTEKTRRQKIAKSIGKPLVLMTAAIAAQKLGLHVAEHFGVAQDEFGEMGTQIVSKVGAITAVNSAIERRNAR